jgi:hypothetical protein
VGPLSAEDMALLGGGGEGGGAALMDTTRSDASSPYLRIAVDIEDMEDGTYTCMYTATAAGVYRLYVNLGKLKFKPLSLNPKPFTLNPKP